MSRRTTALAVVTAVAALALPAAAQAHVTVNPREATAGAFLKLDVRVPNERSDASTVKLQLQLPDGFATASYEPLADWQVKVTTERLATPVQTDDGPVTQGVKDLTWTGSGKGLGRIAAGQFMEFPISVQIPANAAGKTLTFKAIQTYSNGDVVRWIGAADSDSPAPTLTVDPAAGGSDGHGAGAPGQPAAPGGDPGGDGGSDTLGVIALIVGGLGLAAGATALVVTRRPRQTGSAA
jgi:periplasmic copper chaperone A